MRVRPNATSVSAYFKLVWASDGTPFANQAVTGFTASYIRDRATVQFSAVTALTAADSPWAANKAKEVSAGYAEGIYRVDYPDAAFVAGVSKVILCLTSGLSDPAYIEVEIDSNLGTQNSWPN